MNDTAKMKLVILPTCGEIVKNSIAFCGDRALALLLSVDNRPIQLSQYRDTDESEFDFLRIRLINILDLNRCLFTFVSFSSRDIVKS